MANGRVLLYRMPGSPGPCPRLAWLGTGSGGNPFVRRLAVGAEVATPCGPLTVFSVHLGLLRHHNVPQVVHLLSWVTAIARNGAAVIGGDFNAHENTRQITRVQNRWIDTFRRLHPHADGATHELR